MPAFSAAPSISTSSLPSGEATLAYSDTLMAFGGALPYTWSASGLPTGLTCSSGGVISGTPTVSGTFNVTLHLTDANSTPADPVTLSLFIQTQPSVSTTSLPGGAVGVSYSFQMTATGGTPGYTWTVVGLPAGLSMSTSGLITGTPTTNGASTQSFTATDTLGVPSAPTGLSLTIGAPGPQAMWAGYADTQSVMFEWWPPTTQVAWSNGVGTASIAANTSVLVVTAVSSGAFYPLQTLSGTNVPANLSITGFIGNANGGTGSYQLNSTVAAGVASTTITGSANMPDFYRVYKNGVLMPDNSKAGLTNPGVTPGPNIVNSRTIPWFVDRTVTPGVAANYSVTPMKGGVEGAFGPTLTLTPPSATSSQLPAPPAEPSTWIQDGTGALNMSTFKLPVGGVTWTCTNISTSAVTGTGTFGQVGCSLQWALNNSNINGGDIIVLSAGSTYNIPLTTGYTIPAYTGTNGWTYFISSEEPVLKAGGKLPAYTGTVNPFIPQVVSATAAIPAGATSTTLAANQPGITDTSGNWTQKSGWYYVNFYEPTLPTVNGLPSAQEERLCVFTQGSNTVSWSANNGHYGTAVGLTAQAVAGPQGAVGSNAIFLVHFLVGVTPWDSKTNGAMPSINLNNLTNATGITLNPATTKVRFVGIEVTNTGPGAIASTTQATRYIAFSNSQTPPPTSVTPAESVYFDRCLVGAPTDSATYQFCPHGIANINAFHMLIHQCYIYGIATNFIPSAGDANGFNGFNGNRHAFLNSYVQAVAESWIYGGGFEDNVNPFTDLVVRGNMSHKPLGWTVGANQIVATWTLNGVTQGSSLGANGGTLKLPWAPPSGSYAVQLNIAGTGNGENNTATFTNGAVTFSLATALAHADANWMNARGTTPFGLIGREVKNLGELKVGQRVDVSGNLFLNSWVADQAGYNGAAFATTARDQIVGDVNVTSAPGACPYAFVSDVNFYNNLCYNISSPNYSFSADGNFSCFTQRVRFFNNLCFINPPLTMQDRMWGWRLGQGPVVGYINDHNTCVLNTNISILPQGVPNGFTGVQFLPIAGQANDSLPNSPNNFSMFNDLSTVTNNIFWAGGNGTSFQYLSSAPHIETWPNVTFSNNATVNDTTSNWPGVSFQNVAPALIGFQNYQGNAAMPVHPTDWNVVSGTLFTGSTTRGPVGATFGSILITTSSLPNAIVAAAYSTTLAVTGGTAPYTWSLTSATPNWLDWISVSAAGVLSGTPQNEETETVVVKVVDSLGASGSATLTLVVNPQ